jgi:hypothetical protein
MPITNIRGQQILNGTVQYVDIQQVSASKLVGNPTGSAATISEISLGTGLGFSGSSLILSANLQSLSGLSYSSASFVKMTAAGTFALDTNTYVTGSGTSGYIAKWASSSGLGNSLIQESGTTVTANGSVIITASGGGSIEFYPTGGSNATYSVLVAKLGSGLAPTLAFYGDAGGGVYRGYGIYGADSTYDGLLIYRETGTVVDVIFMGANQVSLPSTQKLAWASSGNSVGALDVGLSRESSGLLQVNTGSANSYASIKASSFVKSGGTSAQFLMADGTVSTNPGWITSFSETDTLASVTGRGATTSTAVTFNANVTLGNSADLVFVDLAGTFPTSGKGFDWTLNNDGARIYAIQPSSDSIDLVFQLRDNATTNDRFVFWVDDYQGPSFDKYPLIIRGGTEFDLVSSSLYTNGTLRLSNAGVLQNVSGNISMFTNNVGYITGYTETDTLSSVTGRGSTTTIAIGAPNFYDGTGGYNVNLGSNGNEGRGLVAGYSGGSYGGIGFNVRHTTTGGSWIAPSADTSSYILFTGGGFHFYGAAAGTAGRTLAYTTLGTFSSAGLFNAVNITVNGSQVWHAGNLTNLNQLTNGPGYITGYTETDTLATVTARGASTSTAVTLSSTANSYSGHHYFISYDANGNHYPHYNVGANNNGSKLNLRMYGGSGGTVRLFYLNGNDASISWDGNTIWHAGNDGSGSGLDADLLDGNHASAFYLASNPSGYITAAQTYYIGTTQNALNRASAAQTLTGVSIDGNAGSANYAYKIYFDDGPRDLSNRLPNSFTRQVLWDFVTAATAGGTGNYAGVMTFMPWQGTTASTGDSSYQLAFINESSVNGAGLPGLRLRKGIDTTWGSWYTLIHAGNYNSYSPTLTGTGASGTWSISITGNADTVDGLHASAFVRTYGTTNDNIDSDYGECFITFDPIPSGTPPIQSPNLRTINVGANFARRTQLAFDYATDRAFFRRKYDSAWYSWVEFIHTGNYNSYSPTLTGTGASGSWGISITGNAATASTSSQVTINYGNDSNSTYYMLWGSGNSVYATGGIYCNPSTDTMYTYAYRGSGNVGGTGEASWHPAGIYSGSTQWLYGTTYRNNAATYNQGNRTRLYLLWEILISFLQMVLLQDLCMV